MNVSQTQYLSPYKLKELIRHYSEFVTHPVSLRQIKTVKVPKEKDEFEGDDEPKKDEGDDFEVAEEKEPEMEEVRSKATKPAKNVCTLPSTRTPNSAPHPSRAAFSF
jgi:HSP90 family molecular chaperone